MSIPMTMSSSTNQNVEFELVYNNYLEQEFSPIKFQVGGWLEIQMFNRIFLSYFNLVKKVADDSF